MTTRPALELAHHHPGRLRLRSDALCATDENEGWRERFQRVRDAIAALPGVESVRHNERSGSVLVEYRPGMVDPNALVETAASTGDFDPPSPETMKRITRPAVVAIDVTRKLNVIAAEVTSGRLDLRSAVPFAMVGLAAYSFMTGKDRLPRWDNLAYWAYSIFQNLHGSEIEEARRREKAT